MLCLAGVPSHAGDGQDDLDQGLGLLQEGGRLVLRGLIDGMEPRLRDLSRDLGAMIGDLSAYGPPEFLPNGDIILRRKVPLAPQARPLADPETGEIEL